MSLSPEIVSLILSQIDEARKELQEAYNKKEDVLESHDKIRTIMYQDWDPSIFVKNDPSTYPPILQNKEMVLELLDYLNEGVGYLHQLVIEHRYPEQHDQPLSQQAQPLYQPEMPSVVVQQPQAQFPIQQNVTKGFWSGLNDRRIEGMRLDSQERLEKMRLEAITQGSVDVTKGTLSDDPLDAMGNKLMLSLNQTKKFLTDCYLVFPHHKNKYFCMQVHQNFRARLTRLMGVIESYVHAATNLEIKEVRNGITSTIHLFTNILQAQAQTPVTIQEFNRPYVEGGVEDDNFESMGPGTQTKKKKMPIIPPPPPSEEPEVVDTVITNESEEDLGDDILDLEPNPDEFMLDEEDDMELGEHDEIESEIEGEVIIPVEPVEEETPDLDE